MANEATQRMTTEATSKENDYSKQCVNYFQSWHMGTTNKLLQTALRKGMHSSSQSEVTHTGLKIDHLPWWAYLSPGKYQWIIVARKISPLNFICLFSHFFSTKFSRWWKSLISLKAIVSENDELVSNEFHKQVIKLWLNKQNLNSTFS